MVSNIAIAAAEGLEPDEKPRRVDEIADNSEAASDPGPVPKNYAGDTRRFRSPAAKRPRGPPDDDLEQRIGSKLLFTINEVAELSGKSPASIFRYLRLGQLTSVTVGGYRHFTRAAVLNFLRYGTRGIEAA